LTCLPTFFFHSRQFRLPADDAKDAGAHPDTALGYSFPNKAPGPNAFSDPLSAYERQTAQVRIAVVACVSGRAGDGEVLSLVAYRRYGRDIGELSHGQTMQTGVWSHVAPEAKQYYGLGLGPKSTHVTMETLDARDRVWACSARWLCHQIPGSGVLALLRLLVALLESRCLSLEQEYTLAYQYAEKAVKDKYRNAMGSVSVAFHRLHPVYGSVYKFLTSTQDAKGRPRPLYVSKTPK
jgi:hypothetical protein